VNNLFRKIREAGIDQKIVLRLGNTERMPEPVQRESFEEHYLTTANAKQRLHYDSKLAQQILDDYRVRYNIRFICITICLSFYLLRARVSKVSNSLLNTHKRRV